MPSIFSRIVAGDIPCHKIAEDDRFLAFLDIQQLAEEGHTLVIPKMEVDRYFDLPDDLLRDINVFFARDVRAASNGPFPASAWAWPSTASRSRTRTCTSSR